MTVSRPEDAALPPELPRLLAEAHARLVERLAALAPTLAQALVPWMAARAAKGLPPERYFTHPQAFPLVLLPWWIEEALGGGVDLALQRELLYSSMAGYYVIRLIDDVMDRSDAAEARLLPGGCVLQAEFHASYAALFPSGHPFWGRCHEDWAIAHQAAVEEAGLQSIDDAAFARVSARKVWAGMIPLRAIALRRGLSEVPRVWDRLFPVLCSFHQRHNDLFDWQRDHAAGARTWILSEAERLKRPDETLLGWMAREGFDRGIARLTDELDALDALARDAGSPGLVTWLAHRRALLAQLTSDGREGLAALAPLLAALGPAGGASR